MDREDVKYSMITTIYTIYFFSWAYTIPGILSSISAKIALLFLREIVVYTNISTSLLFMHMCFFSSN